LEERNMRITPQLAVVASLLCLLSGCFPHTRAYQPVSSWEKQVFDRADRNIFPDDVNKSLADYENAVVAWPGIILENKFVEHSDQIEIQFVLEHHYYDWLEDFSVQREKIFLSPRGEGLFRTSWFIKKESNIEEMKKFSSAGNLIIVYGTPTQVDDDKSILLKCIYMRGIDKQWYRTDMLDYGRPGQTVKMIRSQRK
jgi:hypothetical protein